MMESPGTSKKFAFEIIRNLDKNKFTCAIPDNMTEWVSGVSHVEVVVPNLNFLVVLVDSIIKVPIKLHLLRPPGNRLMEPSECSGYLFECNIQ
jgi:hypothetical protein